MLKVNFKKEPILFKTLAPGTVFQTRFGVYIKSSDTEGKALQIDDSSWDLMRIESNEECTVMRSEIDIN